MSLRDIKFESFDAAFQHILAHLVTREDLLAYALVGWSPDDEDRRAKADEIADRFGVVKVTHLLGTRSGKETKREHWEIQKPEAAEIRIS